MVIRGISLQGIHAHVARKGDGTAGAVAVKVRPGWIDDPARYREMGLDFSDGG